MKAIRSNQIIAESDDALRYYPVPSELAKSINGRVAFGKEFSYADWNIRSIIANLFRTGIND